MMRLHAIIIGEKAREPLYYVESVYAAEGKGLEGDRYFYGKGTFNKPQLDQSVREVSILPYESLAECNRRLDSDLDFSDLRRNLVIRDFNAEQIGDRVFRIGSAKFRIVRSCPPCRYLSRLLDRDIMKGLKYIGGYRAIIVKSGMIQCGDEIIMEE
ncbi:MOSC domain-containing protein [Sulfurovum mangrovi]|uniref:MOSC domain-containing protein n=1 Tax=Sulfurovum mangrovi TaxID=2893889 RepID=UPI001E4711C1|nr:MOSC domain-containing protein [Sulfurovum mangrovi]UFH59183.1 MOSC domain-containing protein [Sulfurovum mangrovi]